MPTTSPNMGLIVPVASTGASGTGDVGPGYAQNISTDLLTTIDQHDHSSGKGVLITPAGLNVNADLPFGSNNATQVRSTRYTSQASAIAGVGDVGATYVKSGDLWYVNSSGVQVQVTAGSSLGTGPAGATGAPGQSFVANYFQAMMTGVTGMGLQAVAPSANNIIEIQWNSPQLVAGTVTQPTSVGTGAAWIDVGQAGLYDVSYAVGWTGVPAGMPLFSYATINATGTDATNQLLSGGTTILASQAVTAWSQSTGVAATARRFLVQLGAGTVLGVWWGPATGVAGQTLFPKLSPTGCLLSVAKVG